MSLWTLVGAGALAIEAYITWRLRNNRRAARRRRDLYMGRSPLGRSSFGGL